MNICKYLISAFEPKSWILDRERSLNTKFSCSVLPYQLITHHHMTLKVDIIKIKDFERCGNTRLVDTVKKKSLRHYITIKLKNQMNKEREI